MNKLDLKLGGHPETADDLIFLIDAIKEALVGLSSTNGYNGQNVVILSGVNLTNTSGSTWNWTDGFVWIIDEIFKVDAGSITLTTGALEFSIVETIDSAGSVAYESGSTEDTFIIRRASIVEVSTVGPLACTSALLYSDLILKIVSAGPITLPTWNKVGVTPGAPNFSNGWANEFAFEQMAFRKNTFGQLSIRGTVQNTSFSGGKEVIFTLPAGHRPPASESRYITIIDKQYPGNAYRAFVNGNGEVKVPIGLSGSTQSFVIPEQHLSLD